MTTAKPDSCPETKDATQPQTDGQGTTRAESPATAHDSEQGEGGVTPADSNAPASRTGDAVTGRYLEDAQARVPGRTLGDVTPAGNSVDPPGEPPHTHARTDPLTVAKRLQKRPDWLVIERERDDLIKEGRAAGLMRPEAQQRAYDELDRRYPPPPGPAKAHPGALLENADSPNLFTVKEFGTSGVTGLGDLPPHWAELPANASLAVEVAWVQANRLRVVDGHTVVLSKALGPAPSHAALGWLETSVLFPAKFADVAVRATQHQEDDQAAVRRERRAIDEVRGLLAEMLPATTCPTCGQAIKP